MFPLVRRRRLVWIALFAWLAQLCLPVAHAARMAEHGAGLATWCGEAMSPALRAKLAQLPAEIRDILEQGSAQSERHHDCASACATGSGAAVPPPATVCLRAAGLEAPPAQVVPAPVARAPEHPTARGPPAHP